MDQKMTFVLFLVSTGIVFMLTAKIQFGHLVFNLTNQSSCNVQLTHYFVKQIQNKSKIALLTVISPNLVQTPIARFSVANKMNYARRHNYDFILDTTIDTTRSPLWGRVIALHSAMHSRPDIEWFWYLDMDAFILEKQIDIYDQVIKKYEWGTVEGQRIQKDILISEDCERADSFNSGSYMIRNSPWSKKAMRTLYEKRFFDKHYTNEEQDAMFWLYKNDSEWASRVQIFPMRLANSFPVPACGQRERSEYRPGDMVVHYAGYRQSLFYKWPIELAKWRQKGKLINDTEIDLIII